ncbi:MAG: choice-of-anchor D domain-containing protein, partial [Terriglobales bacterium]
VSIGQHSVTQVSTLTNGTGQVITGLTVSATGEFSAGTTCPSTLPNGASCTISITLTPAITGAATGTITISGTLANGKAISSNRGASYEDAGPRMVEARYVISSPRPLWRFRRFQTPAPAAAATLANIALTGNVGLPNLTLAPASMSWTSGVALGNAGPVQSVTLTNVGTKAITSLQIISTAGFQISANQCGATLSVGASCQVGLAFQPVTVGAQIGTLSVTGADGVSSTVPLNATGSDFTLVAAGAVSAISSGSSAQVPLALESVAGDAQTVTLTCTVAGGSCSVSPASVSLSGTSPVTAMLTVTAAGAAGIPWTWGNGRASPWMLAIIPLLGLAAWLLMADNAERRRRWKVVLLAGAMSLSVACGSGPTSAPAAEQKTSAMSSSGLTATVQGTSSTGMVHSVSVSIPVGGLQVTSPNQNSTVNPPAANYGNSANAPAMAPVPSVNSNPEESTPPPVAPPAPPTLTPSSAPTPAPPLTSSPASTSSKPAQNCAQNQTAKGQTQPETTENGQTKQNPANDCGHTLKSSAKPGPGSSNKP